uniref:Uncharacterized protein n=1 Tax=Parascaris equorum TaxID=6256 RepID=A0A914S703_PAREQ
MQRQKAQEVARQQHEEMQRRLAFQKEQQLKLQREVHERMLLEQQRLKEEQRKQSKNYLRTENLPVRIKVDRQSTFCKPLSALSHLVQFQEEAQRLAEEARKREEEERRELEKVMALTQSDVAIAQYLADAVAQIDVADVDGIYRSRWFEEEELTDRNDTTNAIL